jgi:hypothetical protein
MIGSPITRRLSCPPVGGKFPIWVGRHSVEPFSPRGGRTDTVFHLAIYQVLESVPVPGLVAPRSVPHLSTFLPLPGDSRNQVDHARGPVELKSRIVFLIGINKIRAFSNTNR